MIESDEEDLIDVDLFIENVSIKAPQQEAAMTNKENVKTEPKNLPKYFNGLVKDPLIYQPSESNHVAVGIYETKRVLVKSDFRLHVCHFSTLKENKWINGKVRLIHSWPR